jgi:hypothetical protein
MTKTVLMSVKVERRKVAVTIFRSLEIEHTQVRHLSVNVADATARTGAFISWLVATYQPHLVAIYKLPSDDADTQRFCVGSEIVSVLRYAGIPIWDIGRDELYQYFASPPLVSSRQLREVARRLWPNITGASSAALLEAAALGLFVQIKRLYGLDN